MVLYAGQVVLYPGQVVLYPGQVVLYPRQVVLYAGQMEILIFAIFEILAPYAVMIDILFIRY